MTASSRLSMIYHLSFANMNRNIRHGFKQARIVIVLKISNELSTNKQKITGIMLLSASRRERHKKEDGQENCPIERERESTDIQG